MAYREDIGTLAPARRLDDGRLIVDATFTRCGVFSYQNLDGSERLEYRPESEVFAPESVGSLALVPATDDHPPVMITAINAKQYAIGQVGENVRRDGRHLAGRLVVNDSAAVSKMDRGKRELSCGYDCDLEIAPGISPEGERYDAIQRNIVYNHVAIVDAGRAGSARVRMDARLQHVARADAAVQIDSPLSAALSASPDLNVRTDSTKEKRIMDLTQALAALAAANEKIGGLAAEVSVQSRRADTAENKAKDIEKQLAGAEATAATDKARADVADKARTDAAINFDARVSARASLLAIAAGALGRNDKGEVLSVDGKATIKLDALADRDIRVAVVAKLDGVTIPAERSDDAVGYAFELASDRASKAGKALGAAREALVTHNLDAATPAPAGDREAQAQIRMDKARTSAWKTATTVDDDGKETK